MEVNPIAPYMCKHNVYCVTIIQKQHYLVIKERGEKGDAAGNGNHNKIVIV